LQFMDENNERKFPVMGCYGIGITRLLGVIVEKFNDERGIIWPESVAPFKVHLISLPNPENTDIKDKSDGLYADLQAAGIEVLYDDREGISFTSRRH
jgi:prolyl-tRNA synthetase